MIISCLCGRSKLLASPSLSSDFECTSLHGAPAGCLYHFNSYLDAHRTFDHIQPLAASRITQVLPQSAADYHTAACDMGWSETCRWKLSQQLVQGWACLSTSRWRTSSMPSPSGLPTMVLPTRYGWLKGAHQVSSRSDLQLPCSHQSPCLPLRHNDCMHGLSCPRAPAVHAATQSCLCWAQACPPSACSRAWHALCTPVISAALFHPSHTAAAYGGGGRGPHCSACPWHQASTAEAPIP